MGVFVFIYEYEYPRLAGLNEGPAPTHASTHAPVLLIPPIVPGMALSSSLSGHSVAMQGESSSLLLPGVAGRVGRERSCGSDWKDE